MKAMDRTLDNKLIMIHWKMACMVV